jgi:hypothetical protein
MLKHTITSRGLAVAFCAIVVTAALSACGSSGASSSTAAGAASGTSVGATTARLNLAKCLRSHGINVSDSGSTAGAAGGPGGGIFQAFRNYPRTQVQAAMSACRSDLAAAFPGAALTPAQRAARTAELVKYAQCMRSHGVNIPDPTTSGGGPGGGGFGFGAQGGSNFRALLNTPGFKTANTACASLRPKFGGGRPGGGGGFGGPAPAGASGTGSVSG